jgi:hypothetical protein
LNDRLDEARAELERLQKELESRHSVGHFARTGIASLAALIFAGAAAKLFHDSVRFPILGVIASALCLGLGAYAVHQYRRGKRLLKIELARFESLKALRRTLRIDAPSAQLPR